MTKWEYKYEVFVDKHLDTLAMIKINKLGKDGWELVTFTTVSDADDGGSSVALFKLIFKRPVK